VAREATAATADTPQQNPEPQAKAVAGAGAWAACPGSQNEIETTPTNDEDPSATTGTQAIPEESRT
jgi:hypothetical protein